MNAFDQKINEACGKTLTKSGIRILQVNLGKLCNLACVHCHVEAGPTKTLENMSEATAKEVVRMMDAPSIETVDLTGGAPEMNPYFKYLVEEARNRNLHVIDRCNLTILIQPGYEDLANFLSNHSVEIIASLPCYSKDNVEKQRGKGVFGQSIDALLKLNSLGYGKEGSGLKLNLVYNPVGPHLPPSQEGLEKDYKARLKEDFGIEFNNLYTITNMPIKRYAKYLKAFNQLEDYEALLRNSFNPSTIDSLMCKDTLSISWDGKVFDCDFNQMLQMPTLGYEGRRISDIVLEKLEGTPIQTDEHCFGCTAGTGSSCQGSLT